MGSGGMNQQEMIPQRISGWGGERILKVEEWQRYCKHQETLASGVQKEKETGKRGIAREAVHPET